MSAGKNRSQGRLLAQKVRAAFISALKRLEDEGTPMSESIYVMAKTEPLKVLQAASQLVPKEVLLEAGDDSEMQILAAIVPRKELPKAIKRLKEEPQKTPVLDQKGRPSEEDLCDSRARARNGPILSGKQSTKRLMTTIHLQEWVEELTEDLEAFADWWLDHVQRGEKDFPMDIGRGDWDEQFELFRATRRAGQNE